MTLLPRLAAVASAVAGIVTGAYVLFGPTYTRCSFAQIGQAGIGQPVVTLAPARCETLSLVAAQPVWPMPLLAIVFWSSMRRHAIVPVGDMRFEQGLRFENV